MPKLTKLEVDSIVYAIKQDFVDKKVEFVQSEEFQTKVKETVDQIISTDESKELISLFNKEEELRVQIRKIESEKNKVKKDMRKVIGTSAIYSEVDLYRKTEGYAKNEILKEAELSVPSEDKIRSKVVLSNYDGDINAIVAKVKEEL